MDLSIVVPCLNAQNLLASLLRNLQQIAESAAYAIPLPDNGSEDDTVSVAERYLRKFKQLQIFSYDFRDLSKARNVGISKARGDFVTWIDADDTVEISLLPELIQMMHADELDFLKCDGTLIFSDRREAWRPAPNTPSTIFKPRDVPAYLDYPLTGSGLYRRSFLNRISLFPEGVKAAEDRYFVWSAGLHADRVRHVSKGFYNYDRRQQTALTNSAGAYHFDAYTAYEMIWSDWHQQIAECGLEHAFWNQYVSVLEASYFRRGRLSRLEKGRWLKAGKLKIPRMIWRKLWVSGSFRRKYFLLRLQN